MLFVGCLPVLNSDVDSLLEVAALFMSFNFVWCPLRNPMSHRNVCVSVSVCYLSMVGTGSYSFH